MESIPVEMRRMIMDHLSNAELLTISLVNKLLNYEARSLMRDRAGFVAKLKSLDPSRDIVPFMSDLRQMNVVPFSGINIQLRPPCDYDHNSGIIHREECQQLQPTAEWDPTYDVILDRLPCKSLSVKFTGSHEIKNLPLLELAKRILKRCCGALEELLVSDNFKLLLLIQQVIQYCRFPGLKIVKLYEEYDTSQTPKNFIKLVVSRAPNLQELHKNYELDLLENVLEGSSALLIHTRPLSPLFPEISERVVGVLRFRTMNLYNKRGERETPVPFTVERFNKIVPLILQSSSSTLDYLNMDLVFAVPLMCYGIPLINVTTINFYVDYRRLVQVEPRILTLLKRLNFTRIFPSLSKAEISNYIFSYLRPDHIREFVEQGSAVLQDPQPNRAMNIIKHLAFVDCLSDDTVPFYAQMFPNVEKIWTSTSRGQRIPFQLIWEHWPKLKELESRKVSSCRDMTRNENLDSMFCGIFPQEVAHLREQDDEYLKAVNIVPLMPSITCFRALRTVRLFHSAIGRIRSNNLADPALHVFSKVTGLLAFQKCPNLAVTIATDRHEVLEALDYMTPYASIVYQN